MPTQTPNSGLCAAACSTASFNPDACSSRMQSRIAPWPGSTTRSAAYTSCGRAVTTHLDAAAGSHVQHRLRHRAQVAHAVVDDGHAARHILEGALC